MKQQIYIYISQTNVSHSFCRELVENLLAPKAQKLSSQEHHQLAEMLVAKDIELKELLQQARHQEKVCGTIK